MKIIKRTLIIFILIIALFFSFIIGNILYYETTSKPVKSDVMIVLGCQINGKTPSLMLQDRLKKALQLYKEKYSDYIIVSGGQGPKEDISEAKAMKNWLLKNGISDDKILEENKSTSTFENLKYSKIIMNSNNFKTSIIVSNGFHIYRSLRLADSLAIEASGAPAHTILYLSPYYHCREILSVIKSYILY